MAGYYLLLVGLLLLLGIFFRDSFIFTLVYLFTGLIVLIRWWSARAAEGLEMERSFTPRAFRGETVVVRLRLKNTSRVPILWAGIRESLPNALSRGKHFSEVVTLGPGDDRTLSYSVFPRSRGYHRLGPASIKMGDFLGLFEETEMQAGAQYLIVYPEVVQLPEISLPSWSPLGALRTALPVFPDPARVSGKRDYQAGDSLRLVDWKASAAVGDLQVRLQDPSIAVQVSIFLNFRGEDYRPRSRREASELAVVICASLANWVSGKKAAVGLVTNAQDPMNDDEPFLPVRPAVGRDRLMRVLETLARVRLGDGEAFEGLVRREGWRLSWGSTLVLVTPVVSPALFDEIRAAQKRGLHILIVLCGPVAEPGEIRRKARSLHAHCVYIQRRSDMEAWR